MKNALRTNSYGHTTYYGGVNEHGKPVSRTKSEHPYSYDGFIVWRGGENKEANITQYSDRLYQSDYKKYNELSKKHFGNEGQNFSDREPKKIEAFLRDWCDAPKLKLVFIMEYCNASNGYPLWRFDFNANKK